MEEQIILDNHILLWYIILMMNDPYSQMTSGDRDNLSAEFDEQMAIIDGANNPDMIWVRGPLPQ